MKENTMKVKGHLVGFSSAVDLDNMDEVDFSQGIYDDEDEDNQEDEGERWEEEKKAWKKRTSDLIKKACIEVEKKLKTVKTNSEKENILRRFYSVVDYISTIHGCEFGVSKPILEEFKRMKKARKLNKVDMKNDFEYQDPEEKVRIDEELLKRERKFKRRKLYRYQKDLEAFLSPDFRESFWKKEEHPWYMDDWISRENQIALIKNRRKLIKTIKQELQKDPDRKIQAKKLKEMMYLRDTSDSSVPLKRFIKEKTLKKTLAQGATHFHQKNQQKD